MKMNLLIVMFLFPGLCLASNKVIYNKPINENMKYSAELIKLALRSANYEFSETDQYLTQARQIEDVESGDLSIMWAATSIALEERVRPIRIPLFRGLLGHRLLLIRKDAQARFNNISSVGDLKGMTLGQGKTWTDAHILNNAGFKVVTSNKYAGLFYMLEGGRFDAFPRGVQEPWSELEEHENLNLKVEDRVMIVYPMPLYFFVSKENVALYRDVKNGLEELISTGEFSEYFFGSSLVQDALSKADIKNRLVFRIDNPFLSSETPLDRKGLWLDSSEL